MNYAKPFLLLSFISILFVSCFKDDDDNTDISASEVNNFVWKGMNSWYYWQDYVTALDDTKDDNANTFNAYLNQYSKPENLFNDLLYNYETTDRFSWFIEDYVVQQQAFQGISKSFGIDFQGVQVRAEGDVIIYIKYVVENSPADEAGIQRGDVISAVNGTSLNTSNFGEIVYDLYEDTVTLTFAEENDGYLNTIGDKTITAAVIAENPVYLKKVFEVNGKKVGYLVYTGFILSYNDELNEAFAYFKNENIDQLILDLRLNGGGSVLTSAYLASMIYGAASTEDGFGFLIYNEKHEDENGGYPFFDTLSVFNSNDKVTGTQTINRLNTLSQLYVLTSGGTASASEMIINGLRPYMDVKLIGTTTYGKNVGSITLYDSPESDYEEMETANPNHLYAMQPIVFKIFNKNGESDYTQGFTPDIEVKEYEYWNNILPFGDENEVVLKAALDDISGNSGKTLFEARANSKRLTQPVNPNNKFKMDMYITPDFFKQ
ncbi:MAG: S41 family peptidase [Flavobacteriaceae bacterium]